MTELLDTPEKTKDQMLQDIQRSLSSIEQSAFRDNPGPSITPKDFAGLNEQLESLAANTDSFKSREFNDIRLINQLIDRYVQATREFVITNPLGGDLLAADTDESRDAFRVYLAVESAISGDFETARGMLIDVNGPHQELALESALLVRLEEAELESKLEDEKISPEISISNMAALGVHARPETIEQVEQADPHITIGTTVTVLHEILEPGWRFMTSHEINIMSSGNDLQSDTPDQKGKTNPDYNRRRLKVEQALGHSSNPFLPKIVYGALTSDLQADRGSGYGRVTLHLKPEVAQDPSTTFTYNDSLSEHPGQEDLARSQQLTSNDALTAYAAKIDTEEIRQRTGLSHGDYIEAHVSGLTLEKIERVSITINQGKEHDFARNAAAVDECVKMGIRTEVIIDPQSWALEMRIRERIESGMSEDDAVADMVRRLRSNFTSADNTLFSITFITPPESTSDKEGDYRKKWGYLNQGLFEQQGIIVRHPKVGKRLLEGKRF